MTTINALIPVSGIAIALGVANIFLIIQHVRMDKRVDRLEATRETLLGYVTSTTKRVDQNAEDIKSFRKDLGAMQDLLLKHARLLGDTDVLVGSALGGTSDETDDPDAPSV